MTKRTRRQFLHGIAATAITAAAGFAFAAVKVESQEPTAAEQRERLAHFGDPCVFCGQAHDEVAIGDCPGLCNLTPAEAEQRYAEMLAGEGGQLSEQDKTGALIETLCREVAEQPVNLIDLRWFDGKVWAVSDQADVYSSDDWGATWVEQGGAVADLIWKIAGANRQEFEMSIGCLLYTSPSPRDRS